MGAGVRSVTVDRIRLRKPRGRTAVVEHDDGAPHKDAQKVAALSRVDGSPSRRTNVIPRMAFVSVAGRHTLFRAGSVWPSSRRGRQNTARFGECGSGFADSLAKPTVSRICPSWTDLGTIHSNTHAAHTAAARGSILHATIAWNPKLSRQPGPSWGGVFGDASAWAQPVVPAAGYCSTHARRQHINRAEGRRT